MTRCRGSAETLRSTHPRFEMSRQATERIAVNTSRTFARWCRMGERVVTMGQMSARLSLVLVSLGFATIAWSPALADEDIERCAHDVEGVSSAWQHLEYGALKGGAADGSTRRVGPEHVGPHVEYMRNQLRLALRQCQDGNTKEARLRLDLVRSWLKLPEAAR